MPSIVAISHRCSTRKRSTRSRLQIEGKPWGCRIDRRSRRAAVEPLLVSPRTAESHRAWVDVRGYPVQMTPGHLASKAAQLAVVPGGGVGFTECQLVEGFLLHLVRVRQLSPATHNVYVGGHRLLFRVLGRLELALVAPRRKQPLVQPAVLAPVQVDEVLRAVEPIAPRMILRLVCAADLVLAPMNRTAKTSPLKFSRLASGQAP